MNNFIINNPIYDAILFEISFSQLRATFAKYKELTGKTIETDLKKEFSGDILKALLGIGKLFELIV